MKKPALRKKIVLMAMELSESKWKIGFGRSSKVRRAKDLAYGDLKGLEREIAVAKAKLGVLPESKVVACYEAGRDGFWIYRALGEMGIECKVVDSASIEVPRRKRRAKSDRIDLRGLMKLLSRDVFREEEDDWSVCRVPNEEQEEARRPHREMGRLKKERTAHRNRLHSLLALHGIKSKLPAGWGAGIEAIRDYRGARLGTELQRELKREWRRLELVQEQIREVEREQKRREEEARQEAAKKKVRLEEVSGEVAKIEQLRGLKGIKDSARTLVYEFFGWRQFTNGKDVGAAAGLTPTPYSSGSHERELGISKAGNRRVRSMMIEVAWSWVRYQGNSKLTKWFYEKCAMQKTRRIKRIAIVAVARKLLVALWRYLETGAIPEGAELKEAKGQQAA